jgi:excisionase family DNA binding protein
MVGPEDPHHLEQQGGVPVAGARPRRIDQAVRDRLTPEVPDGWLRLADAAKALGVARQTVLHKVQRGELEAVHVTQGRRKGLRINVNGHQAGLFDQP